MSYNERINHNEFVDICIYFWKLRLWQHLCSGENLNKAQIYIWLFLGISHNFWMFENSAEICMSLYSLKLILDHVILILCMFFASFLKAICIFVFVTVRIVIAWELSSTFCNTEKMEINEGKVLVNTFKCITKKKN